MALNPEKRKIIERQMKTLDYIEGKGLFPREKRSVNGNRYLIISYGGTGSDALYQVKKLLQDELPAEEYQSHVRILAVDTDNSTRHQKTTVEDESGQKIIVNQERFTPEEWLWLDNKPANQAINLGTYDNMKEWINENLVKTMRGNPIFLDGSGAGATRQVGRILLSAGSSAQNFQTKIKTVAGDLTYGNADNLKIFIISGIAGGTGSGIVVDASYLIRDAIEQMGGSLDTRTSYCGFILLPPTGNSDNPDLVKRGNRNGVAALKEIDHFMTITKRNERYEQKFGTAQIISEKNIFDTCYLLDGATDNVVNQNPREKAVEVVKDCILDMVTSRPVVSEGVTTIQDVASFMSDTPAFAQAMVSNASEKIAPREANYIYCAIGHGQTLIPLELMKSYVAKNVFDRMYNIFLRFKNVEEEDVESFLENVECPGDGVFNGASGLSDDEFYAAIDKEVAERFMIDPTNAGKKGGPYYVINLLAAVMNELRNRRQRVSELAMGAARQQRMDEFKVIHDRVAAHNSKYFEVYVTVFEELRKHLEKSSDILCDSDLFRDYYKSSYTVTPIDFGKGDEASLIVRKYLDKMISSVKMGEMCSAMIQEIMANRDEWSELIVNTKNIKPRFSAAQRIRQFWQSRINRIVDATLEDYLIKYYSMDPDAQWEVDEEGNPTEAADKALRTAAQSLVKEMWGAAGAAIPLAELHTNILGANKFNGKKSFLIPQGAPHLIKYVRAEIAAHASLDMRDIQVAPSTANDRISCYAQYTNIPAYMFKWTTRAEPDYEDAVSASTDGLHMSETVGGALWRNFPNLISETVWPKVKVGYTNPREAGLNEMSRQLLAEATALGLTAVKALVANANVGYYSFFHLPMSHMFDAYYLKAVDSEMEGTPAWVKAKAELDAQIESLANSIFSKQDWTLVPKVEKSGVADAVGNIVKLESYSLNFVETVLTPLMGLGGTKPEGWEENLAAVLLRTTPEYSYRLRGTVLVLERLFEMISEAQKVNARMDRFVHYLVADLFEYSEEAGTWYYLDSAGVQRELLEIPYGDVAQETAEYYFMFEAFKKNADVLMLDLEPQYADMLDGNDNVERRKKAAAMAAKKQPVLTKVTQLLTYDRTNPTRPCLVTAAFDKVAAPLKYNVEAIRGFYAELKNALELFIP